MLQIREVVSSQTPKMAPLDAASLVSRPDITLARGNYDGCSVRAERRIQSISNSRNFGVLFLYNDSKA